jgi:precorrin-2 dehydrogenase/sirohydrochlorin ferrochelatase
MPTFYPVFLNLTGRKCVIIGGGQVAEGKISKLLDSGAKIIVISPDATQGICGFAERGQIEFELRKYQDGDLQGAFLVVAATNDTVVNQEIFEEAEKQGILLNAVDDMPRCSFIAPSIVEKGPVTVAISTGGASPALARKLREKMDVSSALDWADATSVLSKARQVVKEKQISIDPQRWQCCMTDDLLSMVQAGHEDDALNLLMDRLQGNDSNGKCSNVAECVDDGCQIKNTAPVNVALNQNVTQNENQDRMAQTAGD